LSANLLDELEEVEAKVELVEVEAKEAKVEAELLPWENLELSWAPQCYILGLFASWLQQEAAQCHSPRICAVQPLN